MIVRRRTGQEPDTEPTATLPEPENVPGWVWGLVGLGTVAIILVLAFVVSRG